MPTTRKRKMFGPLLHSTLACAAIVLVGWAAWRAGPAIAERVTISSRIRDLRRNPHDGTAARALRRVGARAIPHLLQVLEHPNASVRRRACEILREMGCESAAPQLRSAFIAALGDQDPQVRLSA